MSLYKVYLYPIISISLILCLLISQKSFAQTNLSNFKNLTNSSDMIVVGKVTSMQSEWTPKKDRIFTRVNVDVNEYLKNKNPNNNIEIIVPGGEVGEVGELYSDMPQFKNDEEVLLFIKKDKSNNLIVNNGIEGKFNIVNNEIIGAGIENKYKSINSFKDKIKSFVKIQK